jgi:hypothetical protein
MMSKDSHYHTGCINGKKTQITDTATGETYRPYARILVRRRQIRSVKAKEYIEAGCKRIDRPNGVETLLIQDAEVSVVAAEDNARNTAWQAFCACCSHNMQGECHAYAVEHPYKDGDYHYQCASVRGNNECLWPCEKFLNAYDNEQ